MKVVIADVNDVTLTDPASVKSYGQKKFVIATVEKNDAFSLTERSQPQLDKKR